MTILNIIKYPAPVLKTKTSEVTRFDSKLGELLDNMRLTMYGANGVGLAAPQVDVSQRIMVLDVSKDQDGFQEFINPKITSTSGEVDSEEGCLSIPDFRDTIQRAAKITVSAQDRSGRSFELDADGLLAICIQHEIDHLDGILFIDRMSRLKRELFTKWFKKRGPFE